MSKRLTKQKTAKRCVRAWIVLMVLTLVFTTALPLEASAADCRSLSYAVHKVKISKMRPKIQSLRKSNNGFEIKSKYNKRASGWQVRYSTSRTFRKSRTKGFRGKKLDTRIGGLKEYKKYYVKIRLYRLKNGKRHYSKWSKVRRVKTSSRPFKSYYAYTKQVQTTLYSRMRFGTAKNRVWYNTKLRVVGYRVLHGQKWIRVYYKGKRRYMPAKSLSEKLTKNGSRYEYTGKTEPEKKVIKAAMKMYNRRTKYDYTHVADPSFKGSSGFYSLDCSALVSYVLNSAMQPYCPTYNVSRGDVEEYYTTGLVNPGFGAEEFSVTTACKGKPSRKKLRPGDVLFFRQSGGYPIDHVGIYLGNGEFIQSNTLNAGRAGGNRGGVNIAPLRGMYARSFVCAKRFIPKSFSNFKKLDKVLVRNGYTTVYEDLWCTEGKEQYVIEVPDDADEIEIKILYTGNRYYKNGEVIGECAYVEYYDEMDEKTDRGFVKINDSSVIRDPSPPQPVEP